MKYIYSLLTLVLLSVQIAYANNYSYVYIEGDKQTPFYIKLEGQMLPRLGKNYCIIPNLDAGVTYIEILFQQNKYPSQKFAINIPKAGNRGFVLQRVNDRQFALYDLQQGSYIVSGNKPEDDHIQSSNQQQEPSEGQAPAIVATQPVSDELPAFKPEKTTKKTKPVKQETKEQDRFISDMELNTNTGSTPVAAVGEIPAFVEPKGGVAVPKGKKGSKKNSKTESGNSGTLAALSDDDDDTDKRVTATPDEQEAVSAEHIPNSDCREPMSSDEFETFAIRILDKTDDDSRLKVLSKNKGRKCFSTEQVRIIANNLSTQSGRYEVVRLLYAQTSDQGNYGKLESLFKTNYLKAKFKEIINPK
jgi:hypothetical protein